MALQLIIGNKNYSSWSMRPWVLMRELGIGFDERKLRLDFHEGSAFKQALLEVSPVARVPVLVLDSGLAVWDTMAIVETLHEHFPSAGVWPTDPSRRARARSLCAEMHAGFGTLRSLCPMNIEAALPEVGARLWAQHADLRRDVARVEQAWADALAGSGGPFLFGDFCAADAFFAPVCMRLRTYGLPLSASSQAYIAHVATAPGVAAWMADALQEHDWISDDEPYRDPPPAAGG